MNNFKKFDKPSKDAGSVDGFLKAGPNRDLKFNRSYQPSMIGNNPALDNFNRRNGFNAMRAPSISVGGGLANSDKAVDYVFDHNDIDSVDLPEHKTKEKKVKHKRRWSFKKIAKRTSIVLLTIFLAMGVYFGIKLYITNKNIFGGGGGAPALNSNVDANRLKGEGDGRINILLIGKGGEDHPGGELTDTLLVASIDPIAKEAAVLSIPRDFCYKKSCNTANDKINAVYSLAKESSDSNDKKQIENDGISALEESVEQSLGIPIHYYVMVDFLAFKRAVDAVGGIDITLDEAIYDPNFDWEYGRNAHKLPAGKVHLNGTQALLLGRARGVAGGYGVETDFDRNENQRKMLIALKDKILSLGTYSNPKKVNELLSALGDHVSTNFTLDDAKRLNEIAQSIPSSSIKSLDLVTPPNQLINSYNNGTSFQIPRAGLGNVKEIQNFIRNTLKDSFLKNESATVAVYNGTNTAGLASRKAEELRSYGYIVTAVADAPTKNYPKNVIVDLSKGSKKYTKRYLEQRQKTTAVTSMPANSGITPGNVDFVIILGQDEAAASQN